MENLKDLLINYYISKEYQKEEYYRIKDGLNVFTQFLKEKLGYNPIVRGDFIKLEKLPGTPESFMGIEEFTENREYVFLMLILMFLEDKGREEQFLLSHITDFIASNNVGEVVDWTHYYTRRSLIKVFRFCIKYKIIIINDGDEDSFIKDSTREILFESTGISKYMVRAFNKAINEDTKFLDVLNDNFSDMDLDKGTIRRNRVYRNLLLSPVVYKESERLEDYEYIKNYRSIIEQDFEKYLGLKLHVHRNCAILVPEENSNFKMENFPKNSGVSDFVMLVCKYINYEVRGNKVGLSKDDIYTMKKEDFQSIIHLVRKEKGEGLSKEYREGDFGKITYEIIEFMERMKLIRDNNNDIIIYPLCGKLIGDYPLDYGLETRDNGGLTSD